MPAEIVIVVVVALWVEMDSNHRRHKPADLQSAPFGHSGIHPIANAKLGKSFGIRKFFLKSFGFLCFRQGRDGAPPFRRRTEPC